MAVDKAPPVQVRSLHEWLAVCGYRYDPELADDVPQCGRLWGRTGLREGVRRMDRARQNKLEVLLRSRTIDRPIPSRGTGARHHRPRLAGEPAFRPRSNQPIDGGTRSALADGVRALRSSQVASSLRPFGLLLRRSVSKRRRCSGHDFALQIGTR